MNLRKECVHYATFTGEEIMEILRERAAKAMGPTVNAADLSVEASVEPSRLEVTLSYEEK